MNLPDHRQTSREPIETALRDAGAVIRGNSVRCPFHDDRTPSGDLYVSDDGVWRYKCHTSSCGFGGDVYDVMSRASGRPLADVLREHRRQDEAPRAPRSFASIDDAAFALDATARYVYRDPVTKAVDLIVFRCGDGAGKRFMQAHVDDGRVILKGPRGSLPIYNRTQVSGARRVIVVEGEKDVHTLAALRSPQIVATTSPGGAGKANKADWSILAGRDVVIWPDFDSAGMKHADDVRRILESLTPRPNVSVVDVATLGLPGKSDVTDWIRTLGDIPVEEVVERVIEVCDMAYGVGADRDLSLFVDEIVSGEMAPVPIPWLVLHDLAHPILPGSTCVVGAAPGVGKSMWLIDAARFWYDNGIRFALFELEESREIHMMRALAQHTSTPRLTDREWVRANPDDVRELMAIHQAWIRDFGSHITAAPDDPPTLDGLVEWMVKKAQDGCKVLAIDPITVADSDDKPWISDRAFIRSANAIAREYRVAVVLVTHPKKGAKSFGIDDIAGGAAYGRFSSTVLWLAFSKHEKLSCIRRGIGVEQVKHRRSLHVVKNRHGRGTGADIAIDMDVRSLAFTEYGLIESSE